MVSLIILTHNADKYIQITLESLKKTVDADYEVIVVDNASESETQKMLLEYKVRGYIDKLLLLNENTLFARGNNTGLKLVSKKSEWVVLLNSDVEIKSGDWLKKLLDISNQDKHIAGVSFGYAISPSGNHMADGYCLLLQRTLFEQEKLNEDFEWWYAVPELQSKLLKRGYRVIAVNNHEKYIHHFGGKSGDDWKGAKGMDASVSLYDKFFSGKRQVECIYDLDKPVGFELSEINKLRGLYDDGWCARYTDFEIRTLQQGFVIIEGYYPGQIDGSQHIEVKIGRDRQKFGIQDNNFELKIKTKKNRVLRVNMECRFAKKWADNDVREIAFVVKDIRAT